MIRFLPKAALWILAILSLSAARGADPSFDGPEPLFHPPFQAGDSFEYALYWSSLRVGNAVLSFDRVDLAELDTPVLRMRFTVRTSGLVNRIYRVDNNLETYIDPLQWRPLFHRKRQREGSRERDIEITFDWERGIAEYRNLKDGTSRPDIVLVEGTQDPLSLLGKIAGLPFSIGETFRIPATDGRHVAWMEASVSAQEALSLGGGSFDSFKTDVATDELRGVFSKSPDAVIEVWFSADHLKIPLRLRSEVRVGSFYGELVRFRSGPFETFDELDSFQRESRRTRRGR